MPYSLLYPDHEDDAMTENTKISLAFISTWLGGILGFNGQYMLLWILGGVLSAAAALLCYTIKEEA